MIRFFPCNVVVKCVCVSSQNIIFYRTLRTVTRRGIEPKFLKGKVKILTKFDSNSRLTSMGELAEDAKKSKLGNELDIEKAFLEDGDGDFGHAIQKSDHYHDMHISEEKNLKRKVKKLIIERKYFKLDKETNLMTYAAKEQIHFLHKSDPVQWNYKTIAECFPISEGGAKKLLKSNFVPTSSERIKEHDEDVAKKWEILKSGKFTDLIKPKTWQLYKEGKLVDDYFSGNPNLPTTPPVKRIQPEKKQNVGEFSAIIKTYVDYKQKLLNSKDTSSETRVTLRENWKVELAEQMKVTDFRKFKHAEIDAENSEIFVLSKKNKADDTDLPLSQFKEILKDENKSLRRKNSYLTKEIIEETINNQDKLMSGTVDSKVPCDTNNCFIKIPKYNKTDDLKYDRNEQLNVYKYDEKLGYQHPYGKIIKGNISIPSKQRKRGKIYKVGNCVYDDNGELLYKLPA